MTKQEIKPQRPRRETLGRKMMDAASNEYKVIKYDYDLISGKVNVVTYQPAFKSVGGGVITPADRFIHRYEYDAENRLTDVYTSFDDVYWERDASYQYYRHGPLARTVLGQDLVQGIDYAYTLQGWLKGVNGTAAPQITNSSAVHTDMGNDGITGSLVARDAIGFSLHYFEGAENDYKAILSGNTYKPFANANVAGVSSFKSLYNGNIAAMAVNIPKLGAAQLYSYTYDQLNRISSTGVSTGFNNVDNSWFGGSTTAKYSEAFTYDANGNIKTALRAGNLASGSGPNYDMDALAYGYNLTSNKLRNNLLNYVSDTKLGGSYDSDLDDQVTDNYDYDEIGNLIQDKKENIDPANGGMINWTVYGKIASIIKSNGDPAIYYTYDAAGNRISKSSGGVTTWYVRDAQGNTLATYVKGDNLTNSGDLSLKEMMLYGSSRLGIINTSTNVENPLVSTPVFVRGNKNYELTNHLGNVLAVITDRKIPVASGSNVSYYLPEIKSATDYYAFGMPMPGRTFSSESYRYGFNGKENDNEVKGTGNQQDYGMRIYDPRLGRFLSTDPLTKSYPMLTPYQFASNKPINSIDLDGLEALEMHFATEMIIWLMDPLGSKQAKRGAERYIATTSGIHTYQQPGQGPSDPVSQGSMDNLQKNIARADMAEGGSKYLKFMGDTWASMLPAEQGISLGLKGLASIAGKVLGKEAQIAIEGAANVIARARLQSADAVNSSFITAGYEAPYKAGSTIVEMETSSTLNGLVRLTPEGGSVKGSWFTTANEIKGLSPQQIQDKLSLPELPAYTTPVSIGEGVSIRVGEAGPVKKFNGNGGGFQIQLLSGQDKVTYGTTTNLPANNP